MTKLCVDLCSGLEGFSKAFKQKENWQVVTIDIDKKFKPTICADIRALPLRQGIAPDVLLASPPCERFSVACHTWPKMGIMKAMELVGACFEAVAYLKPREWLIENPQGRLRWFLGTPLQTIRLCDFGALYQKKTDLWGTILLPFLVTQKEAHYYLRPGSNPNAKPFVHYNEKGRRGPMARASNQGRAKRAELPYELSQAVLEVVERS